MKKILGILSLFFVPILTFSQTVSYQLQIVDERNLPLPGATITWGGGGTVTDLKGIVSLNGENGSVLPINISFIGYQNIQKTIIFQSQSKPEQIRLQPVSSELNPVVISAGRYEQPLNEVTISMDVIQPKMLSRNNSVNADDALDRVSGVSIVLGQANIRGGSGFSYGAGSRVLMLLDDLPLLSADANDVKWNFIPMENVSQVEVIKGASSTLFGSSALGGVIHFRSDYPIDSPQTKITFFQGVYGAPRNEFKNPHPERPSITTGLSGSHSRKINRLDLVFGFNLLRDEGYRAAEYSKRARINANTRYRFKDQRFQAGINLNYMVDSAGLFLLWDGQNGAFFPDSSGTNSRQLAHRFTIDPFFTFLGNKGYKHSFRNRIYITDNQSSGAQGSKGTAIYTQYQVSKSYNLKWARKTNVSGGIAHQLNLIEGGELYGNRQSLNYAFFTQIDQTIGRFSYSIGGRYEWFSINNEKPFTYPLIRSGLNYQIAQATYLRASYGQGFRAPSVAERYANTQAGAIRIFPNPSLEAERGWSSEIGVKQLFEIGNWQGYLDAAAFLTRYFNMVEFEFGAFLPDTLITDITQFIGFKAKNVTDAQIAGLEISSALKFQKNKHKVQAMIGYTYLDPRDLNFVQTPSNSPDDAILKYRNKHLWRADIQYDFGKIGAGINMRFNSFVRNVDLFFIEAIPGVESFRNDFNNGDLILDGRLNYVVTNQLNVALIVRNMLNQPYMIVPANIGPQRHFVIQVNCIL